MIVTATFPRRLGFTLIELSIVLVIIGLIVGGVLAGQDLIEAARVRRVVSEIDQIETQIRTFQTKYSCLPGDCPNITRFYGQGNCNGTLESGTANCNGNGDGNINIFNGNPSEGMYLFQQLHNAGLNGMQLNNPGDCSFTDSGTGLQTLIAGKNMPASNAFGNNVGWFVAYLAQASKAFEVNPAFSGNILMLAGSNGGSNMIMQSNCANFGTTALNPQAAIRQVTVEQVDYKIDDGRPLQGRVQCGTRVGFPDACAEANGTYMLTKSDRWLGYRLW